MGSLLPVFLSVFGFFCVTEVVWHILNLSTRENTRCCKSKGGDLNRAYWRVHSYD